MKTRHIYIGIFCIALLSACRKDLNQNLNRPLGDVTSSLSHTAASSNLVQNAGQVFQEGDIISKLTFLGHSSDYSNPDKPTLRKSYRLDITRRINAPWPAVKRTNSMPQWVMCAIISNGYTVQNIDETAAEIKAVSYSQPIQVFQEGLLKSGVTYLGQTSDNSDPKNCTRTTSVRLDFEIVKPWKAVWYYVEGSIPWWAIAAAMSVEYEVQPIN